MGGPPSHPLRDHPNFELPTPERDESPIAYALRAAAHLISPPKIDYENYRIKCEDVAKQMMELGAELQQRWSDAN